MARPLQFWHLVVIILLAAMLGTAVGDILGKAFPEGPVGRLLSAGVQVGTPAPWSLDLRVIEVTLGLGVRLTVTGGIAAVAALLIFFRRV